MPPPERTPAVPADRAPAGLSLELAPVDPTSDTLDDWLRVVGTVFKDHTPPDEAWLAGRRESFARQRLTAARAGGRIVGTYRSWDVDLTVPGGTLRADAVSSVTVLPTHRRRGVLTAMIGADLADAAQRGVPVAILIASESPIYGRYGFGPATESVTWTVDTRIAELHPAAAALADEVGVDITTDGDLRAVSPDVYARSRGTGDIDRWGIWWDAATAQRPGDRRNAPPGVAVVARDAGGTVQGILRYTVKEDWHERVIRSVADVAFLHTATPAAYAALWRYLVDLDLVATVRADDRSTEEPLPWLLRDPRAARQSGRCDFLWTRVLDPVAVLAGRRYDGPGATVLEIVDPRGWAAGRVALEVDGDGVASCGPTTTAPDVELPAATLGAVWLGGTDLSSAAAAGLAVERRSGAIRRSAGLLRTATPPWSSTWF